MSRSFLQRFEEQVDRSPQAIAVSHEARELSYRELDERANRLARHLVSSGVTPDSVVAISGERSPELMVAVLGALKAGAGYLPLDASYPPERLAFMLEDSRASFLIRMRGLSLQLPESSPPELEIHAEHPVLREGDASRLGRPHAPDSLAYVIYTSGSTGKPKGVAMVHRPLDGLIEWQLGDSRAGAGTATLQFSPLSFDVHFQELFSTWCSGGRLVLVREETRLETLRLLELLDRENVERIFLPFIALQNLADIAVTHDKLPKTLREVITAGEQLQVTRALAELFTRLPEARLFNHYGPSETHVVTSDLLEGSPASWSPLPPIGSALPHVQLAILGEDRTPVAAGAEGELYIGGETLARGYLHRPELTAERFVQLASGRFYRTGDLVQERADGTIQFLGRLDGQVKVRGYRIELGEIEVALSAEPTVREAAAVVYEPRPGDKRIAAYLVTDPGADLSAIRAALIGRLPEYMLPSAFVPLAALPRTPSGKVDKRSLPVPSRARPALSVELVAPRTPLERDLAAIWSDVLDLEQVGALDNFFELGGNSLLALRTVARIERQLGQALPIVRFFEHPTVAEQAAYLASPSSLTGRRSPRAAKTNADARAPIAIIGMAGRFPGAASVDALWSNLLAGIDSVERFDPGSLQGVSREDLADPEYVPARGVLRGAELFDAGFFGVSPNEAKVLDPQQRLLLELAWHALENAGYAPTALDATVGVYAGTHNNTYFSHLVSRNPDAIGRVGTFATMVASEKDYVATRIAHKLDLTGPALSIHTACSTSLVSIVTAVQQLRAGLCDLALAGGASLSVPQLAGHRYEEGGMLSRDGHTRSFDADASGTVFSDGAALVVLKPLDRALADGDTVYAVIRGVGLNNDGGHKASFTAPSIEGQAAAIVQAQDDASVSPRDIEYVEAHGTATPLGDPIEVEALSQAFRRGTQDTGFCGLGSIKSNFGHLTAAAGVAGLLKVTLSLRNERLPASLHFKNPNPKIDFAKSPFVVVAAPQEWKRGPKPRLAGVSSFGVGGTNAHVVVEEAPLQEPGDASPGPQLLLLSAKSEAALDRSVEALARHLEARPELALPDAAYTLACGRVPFAQRQAVTAASPEEAAKKLRDASQGARARAAATPPNVAFLFPGQGAQYVGMGRSLYEAEPLFKLIVDECAETLRPRLGSDLRALLYPKDGSQDPAILKRTDVTQTALFTVEYALARTLQAWGIQPTALCGHSVGEFVAACLAGVFDLESGLRLICARGQLMESMPTGSMLSVRTSAAQLAEWLPPELDLAAENAPGLCVVAGPKEAIAVFAAELEGRNVPSRLLETSHAFHSRSMDGAAARFREEVAQVSLAAPRLPIVSTATGTWLTDSEATNPDYWASHLRHPVRFATALTTLRTDAERVLVEVGPRKTLTTLALQRQPGSTQPAVRALACWSDAATENAEKASLLDVVGRLWTSGVPVDFASFYRDQRRRRIALPGYSFEPERHWLEAPRAAAPSTPIVQVAPRAPSATSIDSSAVIAPPSSETVPMSSANASRKTRLVEELKTLFEQASGLDFQSADEGANFMELGVDSLLVTQLALRVKNTYRVPVSFRQLMEEYPSLTALSAYLDDQLPAEATPPPATPVVAAPAATAAPAPVNVYAASAPAVFAAPPPAFVPVNGAGGDPLGVTRQMLQLQMAQLDLLQRQLALVGGQPLLGGQALAQPLVNGQLALAAAPAAEAQPASAPGSQVVAKAPETARAAASEPEGRVEYDPKKAFGAIARIYKQSDELTPQQEARLAALVQRYTAKTKSSKAHTQEYRAVHADPRVVTGFKPRIKELIYPIVTARSEGCHLWDLDGNEYVDALNGFGSNFFGYSAKRIADALHRQIDSGYEIGPQTTLAGDSAKMGCQLTGLDRAAFCNTGSEAVMGALRIARTVTGRQLVVAFSGSYHGIFDEVIVRDTKTMRSIPAAPGIMPEAVHNILVLEYGTEKSLQIIRERGEEIAAVLVEPVQSRRPDFQPKEFLKQVREATRASGSALIFDEVITGFRAQPGGAQAYFGIEADLATYGKVVGGGMPIGVIAGRNPWMDALDGGYWQFGDASIPTAGVTYVAGTFVRHPLAMAAVHAALSIMIEEGPALQERVNAAATRLATELNAFFKSVSVPLEIRHFASLWKTFFIEPQPYGELLFLHLRERGVHIYDGFPCFMTVAHTEQDVTFIIDAFKSAIAEMQAAGFLPGGATTSAPQMDASKPPVTGARLGRDAHGNPAWFVPDPNASGKYLQLT